MDTVNHLRDLLSFDLRHLRSAEEQIEEALPAMIEKARNPQLKQALQEHLEITRNQRQRVEALETRLGEQRENAGLLDGLLGLGVSNKGVEGIIDEAEKLMRVDMAPEVMDAAIIGAAQKVEHWEIAAYGTARTFAEELGMVDVAEELQAILDEEHEANDLLTELAEGGINHRAELGDIPNDSRDL
jgi:ferritin-like metal-binding protein YciE